MAQLISLEPRHSSCTLGFDELVATVQFIGASLIDTELALMPDLERLRAGSSPYALSTFGWRRSPVLEPVPNVRGYRLAMFGRVKLHGDGA